MSATDWVPGDMLGLQIPAHSEALRAGGVPFRHSSRHGYRIWPRSRIASTHDSARTTPHVRSCTWWPRSWICGRPRTSAASSIGFSASN